MNDWREEVLSVIRRPEALMHKPGERNKFILQAHFPPSFVYLFDRTTARMDYSQAAWMRRAVGVQLAHQNDIDLSELLGETNQVRRRGSSSRRRYESEHDHDDLQEIGLFCPHPGCDGAHFR